MDLHKLSGWEIAGKIKAKKLSFEEVFDYFHNRIIKFNPQLNAVVRWFDKPLEFNRNSDSPLAGVPIVIKDNICLKGKETTCASRILKGFVSPYDSTVVQKLKNAGLQILGAANMDEFAFGSSCETSCYGPVKNPWDKTRVPGGSSGGSAAVVSAGLSPVSLGSDTGGSIRQPASFCGVCGLKPTYGKVSRYGLIAFGSSFDQIGPFSRDIQDCLYLLNIISGKDPKDSTSVQAEPLKNLSVQDISGLCIGVPKEYFIEGLSEDVDKTIRQALSFFKNNGAVIKEISLPSTEYSVAVYYILASSEASSNLSRFDGIKYGRREKAESLSEVYFKTRAKGFGREAKRRIMLGTFSLSSGYYEAYYLKALKARQLIKEDFKAAFKKCDLMITPTSPTAAFKIGEKLDNPLSMYLSDIFTISASLAGLPALSVPCGFTSQGLPVGMQIIGNYFQEEMLFNLAGFYQKNTDWHKKIPQEYE